MRLVKYIAVLVLGGLSLAAIATSETLNSTSNSSERVASGSDGV